MVKAEWGPPEQPQAKFYHYEGGRNSSCRNATGSACRSHGRLLLLGDRRYDVTALKHLGRVARSSHPAISKRDVLAGMAGHCHVRANISAACRMRRNDVFGGDSVGRCSDRDQHRDARDSGAGNVLGEICASAESLGLVPALRQCDLTLALASAPHGRFLRDEAFSASAAIPRGGLASCVCINAKNDADATSRPSLEMDRLNSLRAITVPQEDVSDTSRYLPESSDALRGPAPCAGLGVLLLGAGFADRHYVQSRPRYLITITTGAAALVRPERAGETGGPTRCALATLRPARLILFPDVSRFGSLAEHKVAHFRTTPGTSNWPETGRDGQSRRAQIFAAVQAQRPAYPTATPRAGARNHPAQGIKVSGVRSSLAAVWRCLGAAAYHVRTALRCSCARRDGNRDRIRSRSGPHGRPWAQLLTETAVCRFEACCDCSPAAASVGFRAGPWICSYDEITLDGDLLV